MLAGSDVMSGFSHLYHLLHPYWVPGGGYETATNAHIISRDRCRDPAGISLPMSVTHHRGGYKTVV